MRRRVQDLQYWASQGENRSVLRIGRGVAGAVIGLCLLDACPQETGQARTQQEAPVDINHATLEELAKVPGMARVWAARIVRFRPYRAKDDLVNRGVVPSEVYERIKDRIVAHRNKQ